MTRLLATLALLAAACTDPAPLPDAAPSPDSPPATACPSVVVVGDDRPDCPPWFAACDLRVIRADECEAICHHHTCPGATVESCEAECRAYTFRGSYCPAGAE